jgi:hypothetical protein
MSSKVYLEVNIDALQFRHRASQARTSHQAANCEKPEDAIIDLCDTPPPTAVAFRCSFRTFPYIHVRLSLKDISVMSFFGFDTNLPRDRQPGQQTRGIFENTDPFAEVARAQAQGLSIDDDA